MTPMLEQMLAGRTIAIPETRELDIFAGLLERRGASVLRCPMVAIHDAPDATPVLTWIKRVVAGECDDLIFLTGEGIRRLLSCIERNAPALRDPFVAALAKARKITRGPKPARALRELGLQSDIAAEIPTTEGVIAVLQTLDIADRVVGVQLYGTDPNRRLIEFIQSKHARTLPVSPYVYADAAEDEAIKNLATRLLTGDVDAIAFTSMQQVTRLFAVVGDQTARAALEKSLVAAVGPIVAQSLEARGVKVALTPADAFFLKPLTRALEEALGPKS